jgi:uncharacterized protein YciI
MTEDHKKYLDNLRESGVINMFGATLYLVRDFPELNREEAKTVLSEWMRTFGN